MPAVQCYDAWGEFYLPFQFVTYCVDTYAEVVLYDAYHLMRNAKKFQIKTALDLGANYGFVSRLIKGIWNARVVSFECDTDIATYLAVNASDCEWHCAAVAGFASTPKMFEWIACDDPQKCVADIKTLQWLSATDVWRVMGVDTLDLMKIDVEGYELGIIHEMAENGILPHIRHIVGEWHGEKTPDTLQRDLGDTHDVELNYRYHNVGLFTAKSKTNPL